MSPHTVDIWKRIAKEFWNIRDGKHVGIQVPAKSGSQLFNNKKKISIVLLARVDAPYNFITIDIGSYGKNSHIGIFADANLGKAFKKML